MRWFRRNEITFTCFVCRARCTARNVETIAMLSREHAARCVSVDRTVIAAPDGVITVAGDLTCEAAAALKQAFN